MCLNKFPIQLDKRVQYKWQVFLKDHWMNRMDKATSSKTKIGLINNCNVASSFKSLIISIWDRLPLCHLPNKSAVPAILFFDFGFWNNFICIELNSRKIQNTTFKSSVFINL